MYSRHVVKKNFLKEVYPGWHMVLYDAVSSVKGFQETAAYFIDKILSVAHPDITNILPGLDSEAKFYERRAIGIITSLFENNYSGIIEQLKDGIQQPVINDKFDGLILQNYQSERWGKKYGKTVNDTIIAVPGWSRVIALSTTDLNMPLADLEKYERVQMEKFCFYPFFNRSRGVRSRSILRQTPSEKTLLAKLGFLLKTCKDVTSIGTGNYLPAFTPITTYEGLRLAFYFGVICKISKVETARSPTGYGYSPGLMKVTVSDLTGSFICNLTTPIFQESLDSPQNITLPHDIKDPIHLSEYNGWLFVIGAWFLGDENPFVGAIQFLDNVSRIKEILLLSYLRTHRKAKMQNLIREWQYSMAEFGYITSLAHVACDGDWVYYVDVPDYKEPFIVGVKNRFVKMSLSEILKHGIGIKKYREWEVWYKKFVRINPDVNMLYTGENPEHTFLEIFSRELKREEPSSDVLNLVYYCYHCNLAFTEYDPRKGTDKICDKCGKFLVILLENHTKSSNPFKRRSDNAWRLGTDSWLRSISR